MGESKKYLGKNTAQTGQGVDINTVKKNNTGRILLLLSAFFLTGFLLLQATGESPAAGRLFLQLSYGNQNQTISGWQEENSDTITFFLPSGTDQVKWRLKEGGEFWLDGKKLEDGQVCEFESGKTCGLLERRGFGLAKRRYEVVFLQSEGLPGMFLETETGKLDYLLEDKKNSEKGSLFMVDEEGNVDHKGSFVQLKGRGNYTWLLDKKSFSLNFEEPAELIDSAEDTQWVLMASASEDTHLINRMVFEMMREAGISNVQQSAWVDLYINGEYAGNYLLSRKVTLPEEADDSWMVEFDGYWKEEGGIGFDTLAGEAVAIKYPEMADETEQSRIREFVQQAENAVLDENGVDTESGLSWRELTDADSLVKKYVLDEISKCPDGWNGSNYCYLRDGKMYFGAPWDYEFSFGNQPAWFSNLKLPQGLYHKEETSWYRGLYKKAEFLDAVREIYGNFFRPYLLLQADENLDRQAEMISASMKMDAVRWGRDGQQFERKVEDLKNYIYDRIGWLDREWLSRPFSEVPYYKLHLMDGEEEYAVYYIREGGYVEETMLERREDSFTGWYTDSACTRTADMLHTPVYEDIFLYSGWNRTGAKAKLLLGLVPTGIFSLVLFLWLLHTAAFPRKKEKGKF